MNVYSFHHAEDYMYCAAFRRTTVIRILGCRRFRIGGDVACGNVVSGEARSMAKWRRGGGAPGAGGDLGVLGPCIGRGLVRWIADKECKSVQDAGIWVIRGDLTVVSVARACGECAGWAMCRRGSVVRASRRAGRGPGVGALGRNAAISV
eukprot:6152850-Prymnesium_polylepis.1